MELELQTISMEEKIRRKAIISFARGSVRFEGMTLTSVIEFLNEDYINGEINKSEHTRLCMEAIEKNKND